MSWLFWKEYRQNRPVLWATVCLVLLPHLVFLCILLIASHSSDRYFRDTSWRTILAECLMTSSFFSAIVAQLALALVGGNVIAGERADRSVEFQAYLPIKRSRVLVAKILFSLAIADVIWLPNLFLMWATAIGFDFRLLFVDLNRGALATLGYSALTGLVFFCGAWFVSSLRATPVISVFGGLIAPLLLVGVFMLSARILRIALPLQYLGPFYCVACPVFAVICFGLGTWLYLRRVEP
jgi:ABC-type transport system involved in multi-copper enzyme maturation permease subunit